MQGTVRLRFLPRQLKSNRTFNQNQGASTTTWSQPASQTMGTTTAAAVDEFDYFCFVPDHSSINPSTKAGQTLFNDLSKYSIKEKDQFKGKLNVSESTSRRSNQDATSKIF